MGLMRRTLLPLLFVLLASPVSGETMGDGLQAYDGGRYAAAVAIWTRLAKAGNVDAQTALAGLYISAPPGVEYAPEMAARLYRDAALQGDAVAQMNLGDFYAKGQGVTRDLAQAAFWLQLAAEQNFQWAADRRAEIAKTMSQTDLTRSAELVKEWRLVHPK